MPFKDKSKAKAASKKWRKANREKVLVIRRRHEAKYSEHYRAYKYEWLAAHQDWYNTVGRKLIRSAGLKSRYGITLEEYDKKLGDQDGVCALCGQPETVIRNGKIMNLHVDHDHKTGMVRGLLCANCNHFVGWVEMVRDNPERVASVNDYLALWASLEVK